MLSLRARSRLLQRAASRRLTARADSPSSVALLGQMQDSQPLLIQSLIEYAARAHPQIEVVSQWCSADAVARRCDYAGVRLRSRALGAGLRSLGVTVGDRVTTLAFNHQAHFECYFGVPGIGAVLHTLNPRLYDAQLMYIIAHAAPTVFLVDEGFAPLLRRVLTALEPEGYAPRAVVVMPDGDPRGASEESASAGAGWLRYEELLAQHSSEEDTFEWADALDERSASGLCYTSGTTGDPKGVLFSHRSTVLHSMASLSALNMALKPNDVVLPFVPMFHVNAWGLPWSAALAGSKLCLLAGPLEAGAATRFARDECVTMAAGVPTVFLSLLDALSREQRATGEFELLSARGRCVLGGSATPPSLAHELEQLGTAVIRTWGMTELSPIGVMGAGASSSSSQTSSSEYTEAEGAGRELYGVELRVVDETGAVMPRDGEAHGELEVRGPWTIRRYYGADTDATDTEGWFKTGDVATIGARGDLRIRDRAKDVVKSGGEWISSTEIEAVAIAHPEVDNSEGPGAACIAAPHPKWDERPLLIVRRKPGSDLTADQMLAFFEGKVAKWWIPDDVLFIDDALPLTGTGKISKLDLRRRFKDHKLRTI